MSNTSWGWLRASAKLGTLWQLVLVSSMLLMALGYGVTKLIERARLYIHIGVTRNASAKLEIPQDQSLQVQASELVEDAESLLTRRNTLGRLGGAGAFLVSSSVIGWGAVIGRYAWEITEVPIRMAKLPKALDGFTIAQISDLHIGPFMQERDLARGLRNVLDIRADLIVLTGDILDFEPQYIPMAARGLRMLQAREGVFCIPGNHDYYTGANAVLSALSNAGLKVLLNSATEIAPNDGGGFALLGVDDLWAKRFRGRGPDLQKAKATVSPDLATVLLAHQPRYFDSVVEQGGVDLQLSGHTHGGQVNPGFRIADTFMNYVAGRYQKDGSTLYVNRGFGTAGPPCRLGAPPEITKIVLVAG